jgi:hypothetical protein
MPPLQAVRPAYPRRIPFQLFVGRKMGYDTVPFEDCYCPLPCPAANSALDGVLNRLMVLNKIEAKITFAVFGFEGFRGVLAGHHRLGHRRLSQAEYVSHRRRLLRPPPQSSLDASHAEPWPLQAYKPVKEKNVRAPGAEVFVQ